jgi:hypothetical protein
LGVAMAVSKGMKLELLMVERKENSLALMKVEKLGINLVF